MRRLVQAMARILQPASVPVRVPDPVAANVDVTVSPDMCRARLLSLAERSESQAVRRAVFDVLFRLQNFASATRVGLAMDPDAMSFQDRAMLARSMASSTFGVQAETILRELADQETLQRSSIAELLCLLDSLPESGLPVDEKLDVIDRARPLILAGRGDARTRERLDFLAYGVHCGRGASPDPLDFVPGRDVSALSKSGRLRVLTPLKLYGRVDVAFAVLEQITAEAGLHDPGILLMNFQHRPEWVVERIGAVAELPAKLLEHRGVFNYAVGKRTVDVFHAELFRACRDAQYAAILGGDVFQRTAAVRSFLAKGCDDEAERLLEQAPLPDTSLPAANVRGFRYFRDADFPAARQLFMSVLEESPGEGQAAAGLRLVLARIGRSREDILDVRERIGYGAGSKGRPGVLHGHGDYILATLYSGRYAEGLYAKRTAACWEDLQAFLGDRFLNYRLLPERLDGMNLFLIADEGVGDEVRTIQFYGALAQRGARLTVTCDPRLLPMLERSYPGVRFLPVSRLRPGVRDASRDDQRFFGFSGTIRRYLTEDVRSDLCSADVVTFGQSLFFNHFCGRLARPPEGAYLFPAQRMPRHDGDPLRVGLLWRSHLVTSHRSYIYLDVADFLPLTGLDGVELWSIQHCIDAQELAFCAEHGVQLIPDVDLFDDFEGMAPYLERLDLIIGISSLPAELGAALGTPVWFLGFSPENYYLRTSGGADEHDRLTMNAVVVAPPVVDFSMSDAECIQRVMAEVVERLQDPEVRHALRRARK